MNTAWLIPILPLAGFLFSGLFGKRLGKPATAVVSVGVVFLSFFVAVAAFFAMKAAPGQRLDLVYGNWMTVGSPAAVGYLSIPFGLTIDSLSGTMMLELGVLLLVAPEWVSRLGVAFALLALAVAVTWIAARLTRGEGKSG